MIVTCNLCGSTFHGNIEPYCFDEQKDPDWAKSLRKYERQKWIIIKVANHGEYIMTSRNKCCVSGNHNDIPTTDKIRKYADSGIDILVKEKYTTQQPIIVAQTLF